MISTQLTLESPVEYTKTISPICLPPACFVGDNTIAIGMGWGNTKSDRKNSEVLRHANLKIVSNEDCQAVYKEDDDITDHLMWAYAHGKTLAKYCIYLFKFNVLIFLSVIRTIVEVP
jgi:hypothetical protein